MAKEIYTLFLVVLSETSASQAAVDRVYSQFYYGGILFLFIIYLILILAALGLGCFALTFSNLPGPEIKPMSPVLAGGFLSAMPPGKSDTYIVTIPVLSQMGLPVSSI